MNNCAQAPERFSGWRAYASGMISLPEGMMEMETAADPDMMEGADDEE